MADRTSAGIFEAIFTYLAENPDDRNRELARRLANLTRQYDFCSYQMGCDEALIKLGLARPQTPEENEAGGVTPSYTVYFDDDNF